MARDDRSSFNRNARPRRPGQPPRRPPPRSAHAGDRIAKVIARAGLASRRDAEDWIAAGRVAVNGEVITSAALNVGPKDRITIDGAPLPERERTRLFLYHKPGGLVTTNADPEGRPTVFERLPKHLPRLISVGRLDINTEGLLLLTNDGGLARVLELPETGWLRRYRVRALGRVTQDDLDRLKDGITIDGIHYGAIEASLDREQGANVWLTFAIREGKNREVRNVLEHLGLQVNRLIRVSYGPFQIGEIEEGAIEEVRTRVLREQLGEEVIAQAKCDFSAPIVQRAEARLEPPPQRERRDERERGPRQEHRRFDERPPRRDHRGDRTPADQGRPRRGDAWRADDAPLRRHYRGERKADPQGESDPREKRAGLLKDRKGRRILVERIGTAQPKPDRQKAPPKGGRGARPDRPRSQRFDRDERPSRSDDKRPFRRGERSDRPAGARFEKTRGERFEKPRGERFDKPHGERFGKPRGERPFKPHGERVGKPRGERPVKPRGKPRRPDRSSGPRPSRPR